MIKLENVTKVYKGDVVALRDGQRRHPEGRVRLPRRPVGLGQVHDDPPAEQAGGPDRRARSSSPARTSASSSSWKVPYLRRNIGCVFQDFKLLTNKTVYENVAFALEVIGRPRHVVKTQVPAILELVGLSKKHQQLPRRALRR